ncbi:MAG: PaaI family thioesterase [Flavobacteriales bacterium]|nr:PaaI family thioesterase [Flavobacteriales bacterium]
MEKLIEIYNQVNQFGRENGMKLEIIAPGEIEYRMEVSSKHLATPSTIHGGMIAAMMDGVLGVAALSAVAQEGKLVATVEFKISYYQPALVGDLLIGKGKVDKKGNRIIFAEGEIFNQHHQTVAKASGTFNAYPFEKSDVAQYLKNKSQEL